MTTFASLLAVVVALTAPPAEPQARMDVPWRVGERAEYDIRFTSARVGTGSMEVMGIVPIRGRDAWHTQFRIKGGTFIYRVNDVYESWTDVTSLASLRYHQDIDQGMYERLRKYEIYPERGVYMDSSKNTELATVESPLDEDK